MKLKCIAIDDEPLALDIIVEYCRKISFLELVETFDNALDVIEFLKTNRIDLMFLDIQMEELTGIQLLNILQNKPKVILTTAYENYALKGYELDVSDYLLKPISLDRFTLAVNKVYGNFVTNNLNETSQKNIAQNNSNNNMDDFIFIKSDTRLLKVVFKDILYIEGQGDYLSVVTVKGKYMTLQNFATIQKSLPYPEFVRVHKSYIISFNKIDRIEKNRVFIGDKNIPVSETYRNEFMQLIRSKEV